MDISYLLILQEFREMTGGVLNSFFLFMTSMGETTLILMVFSGLYWCINKRLGQQLLFIYTLANVFLQVIKLTVCAYRPWIRSADILPPAQVKAGATGYSFPSGHTLKAAVAWCGLGWYFHEESCKVEAADPRRRICHWLRDLFLLLLLLIGFSRNYFGVHTPQDVIVGAVLGVITLFIGRKIWIWQENGHANGILAGGLLFSLIVGIYISMKGYPMDYLDGKLLVDPEKMILDGWFNIGAFVGFLIGWFVERRWISFVAPAAWPDRLCCFLFGAAGLILMLTALSGYLYLVLGRQWGTLAAAGVQIFYILAVYPWLWGCLTKGHSMQRK